MPYRAENKPPKGELVVAHLIGTTQPKLVCPACPAPPLLLATSALRIKTCLSRRVAECQVKPWISRNCAQLSFCASWAMIAIIPGARRRGAASQPKACGGGIARAAPMWHAASSRASSTLHKGESSLGLWHRTARWILSSHPLLHCWVACGRQVTDRWERGIEVVIR